MAVLRVDHPDVCEFVTCRTDEPRIANFSICVAVTDTFMDAVDKDAEYELINPQDGQAWKTARAREIFELIVQQVNGNGESSLLFLRTTNLSNPVRHLYEIEAVDPYGGQGLGPYESCRLGSLDLSHHVTCSGSVDWEKLEHSTRLATRFLDNVVTASEFVAAMPQLEKAALRTRRIGLGFVRLRDLMHHVGLRYGSKEAQELSGQIAEFVRYHAMLTSIDLARESGPFPSIKGSIYDPQALTWQPPRPLQPYRCDFGRPSIVWDSVIRGIKAHGIRNATQTAVSSYGWVPSTAQDESVFAATHLRGLNETAQDIEAPEELVSMQAAIQSFIDNQVSTTISYPPSTTHLDVAAAIQLAWKLGCKTLKLHVKGSRAKFVPDTKELQTESRAVVNKQVFWTKERKPRSTVLYGETYRVETALGTTYVTVNKDEDEQPFEVFVRSSRVGSDTAAVSEALGRLISYILRLSSPVEPIARLATYQFGH